MSSWVKKLYNKFTGKKANPSETVMEKLFSKTSVTLEQQANFQKILDKYEATRILKGSEFLLPPADALSLLEDLSGIGIVFFGVTVWSYVKLADGSVGILDEYWNGFSVPEDVLMGGNVISESAALSALFIQNLPESIDLVSLDVDFPYSWIHAISN